MPNNHAMPDKKVCWKTSCFFKHQKEIALRTLSFCAFVLRKESHHLAGVQGCAWDMLNSSSLLSLTQWSRGHPMKNAQKNIPSRWTISKGVSVRKAYSWQLSEPLWFEGLMSWIHMNSSVFLGQKAGWNMSLKFIGWMFTWSPMNQILSRRFWPNCLGLRL